MGGPQSNLEYVLSSDSPRMVSVRKGMDLTKVEQTMRANAGADPGSYGAQLGPAPVLFQYGLHDEEWVPLKDAKDYVATSTGPKGARFLRLRTLPQRAGSFGPVQVLEAAPNAYLATARYVGKRSRY
jgi:hypothetical protein